MAPRMLGLGTDIVLLSRMADALESGGAAFRDRVFTPDEQASAAAHPSPVAFYAKSFAAKEAVFKTLGTGWEGGIELREIEIRAGAAGEPVVAFHGEAAHHVGAMGSTRILLSVSYDGDYAIAVASLERA